MVSSLLPILSFALRNWKPLALIIITLAALATAYGKGVEAERTRQQLNSARAEIAAREEVIARYDSALSAAQRDAIARAGQQHKLEEQVKDYAEELAAAPGRDCALDGRDIERLRGLRLTPRK